MSHPIDKLGFPPSLASSSSWAWLFGGIAQDVIDHDGVALSDPRLLGDVVSRRGSVLTPLATFVTSLGTGAVLYLLLAGLEALVWRRCTRCRLAGGRARPTPASWSRASSRRSRHRSPAEAAP